MHDSLDNSLHKKVIHFQDSAGHILVLPSISEVLHSTLCSNWFEPDYWLANNRIIGQSQGRHVTWFLKAPQENGSQPWVLRHYYRGGLVAKINNDNFFYTGLKNSRCYREVKLLEEMVQMQLPVPKPIAARLIRHGFFYRADLLMEKLQAEDLVVKLGSEPLTEKLWQGIGKTIADFHHKGIYHADLNAHNILIDDTEKIWLIDFDRCAQRAVRKRWQVENLQRLQRSFLKEKRLNQTFYFTQQDWHNLENGYLSCSK